MEEDRNEEIDVQIPERGKSTEDWYRSLSVKQKIHIASKVEERDVVYPECTKVWLGLEPQRKETIRRHCEDDHNFKREIWTEGDSFSY